MTRGALESGGEKLCSLLNNIDPHSRVYPILDSLISSDTAPMMCAGITVYSPLRRFGAKKGRKVNVIGIGGLGHYAVMFAKALGAEVWAISRSRVKETDARQITPMVFLSRASKAGISRTE